MSVYVTVGWRFCVSSFVPCCDVAIRLTHPKITALYLYILSADYPNFDRGSVLIIVPVKCQPYHQKIRLVLSVFVEEKPIDFMSNKSEKSLKMVIW